MKNNSLAVNQDASAVGLMHPAEDFHQRGLTGGILSQQVVYVPFFNDKICPLKGFCMIYMKLFVNFLEFNDTVICFYNGIISPFFNPSNISSIFSLISEVTCSR